MDNNLKKMKLENPNYSEQELKFIESALLKKNLVVGFQKGYRVFVQGQNENQYSIHIGSEDPNKGGSGENYSIQKSTGQVDLESTETYAPAPNLKPPEEK